MYFPRHWFSVCPSCSAVLSTVRHASSFQPGRVLVVQKISRLDYERSRGNWSERELQSRLSELGSDYQRLLEKHAVHHRSIDEVLSFLQGEGVCVRVCSRGQYNVRDVEWADTILSLGGDGNFLFTASKVTTPDKLVIGLNTDPRSSEGYLCLPSTPHTSLTHTLVNLFRGRVDRAQRSRIRVCVGDRVLPVRALNEVYVGETCLSQASSYELSCDNSVPEKQKSSGVIIYTGTGSTAWAYNMNQLTEEQVIEVLSLTEGEGLTTPTARHQATIERVTRQYNASNVFKGEESKMAFVVREPIVRGLFAAVNTRGYAQTVRLKSNSWHAALIMDGDYQYHLPRGSIATCTLHEEDRLSTVNTTRTNDCFL